MGWGVCFVFVSSLGVRENDTKCKVQVQVSVIVPLS